MFHNHHSEVDDMKVSVPSVQFVAMPHHVLCPFHKLDGVTKKDDRRDPAIRAKLGQQGSTWNRVTDRHSVRHRTFCMKRLRTHRQDEVAPDIGYPIAHSNWS